MLLLQTAQEYIRLGLRDHRHVSVIWENEIDSKSAGHITMCFTMPLACRFYFKIWTSVYGELVWFQVIVAMSSDLMQVGVAEDKPDGEVTNTIVLLHVGDLWCPGFGDVIVMCYALCCIFYMPGLFQTWRANGYLDARQHVARPNSESNMRVKIIRLQAVGFEPTRSYLQWILSPPP